MESHQEILSEPDPTRRWYKGIWKISGNFEYAFTAQELDENDKVVGHIFTGSVEHPAEASSAFCLELAARYAERKSHLSEAVAPANRHVSLRTFWEKYGIPIIVGVIATVVGGLFLAVLLQ